MAAAAPALGEDQHRPALAEQAESGKELLKLTRHTGDVRRVAFRPDGKRIASGGGEADKDDAPRDPVRMVEKVSGGEVKLWDAESGKELRSIKADRDQVNGTPRAFDLEAGKELFARKAHPSYPTAVAFSPDGA
jgi:WD40 repeat protein